MSENLNRTIDDFLNGKSDHTRQLFNHFVNEFSHFGIELHPAKTMIGVGAPGKRVAWITQFGKNFIHVVFPFKRPYPDNLCFQKIAQVPGTDQFNHHFRMLYLADVTDEVRQFMKMAVEGEL